MKQIKFIFSIFLLCITLQSCGVIESTEDKQIKSCLNDIKLGFGDPNSLELISTKEIDMGNGAFRIRINFTAKNALGGRVRGDAVCGFKSKDDINLDPEDFMNQRREISRNFKSLGIRY